MHAQVAKWEKLILMIGVALIVLLTNYSFIITYGNDLISYGRYEELTDYLDLSDQTKGNTDYPLPAPSEPLSDPEGESSKDSDSKEEINFKCDFKSQSILFRIIEYDISINSYSNFRSSFHNRHRIPLFVLQHSWKSFLG